MQFGRPGTFRDRPKWQRNTLVGGDIRPIAGNRESELMKEIVAVVFGLGLVCNALLFVPQVLAVWRKKTDEGISLITFGGFSILQVIGIVHGLYQHDLSLILGMSASLLSCGTVTALTIFYRMRRIRSARTT
jgi:MtN3 and saliva related transmembrane protein